MSQSCFLPCSTPDVQNMTGGRSLFAAAGGVVLAVVGPVSFVMGWLFLFSAGTFSISKDKPLRLP
jgi:hypothetical protein